MPFVLRDYQHDTLEAVTVQWERGIHATVANLFTGAGKTVIFVEYVKRYVDLKSKRVLIVTPAHLTLKTRFKFTEMYPDIFRGNVKVNGYKMTPILGMEIGNVSEPTSRIIVSSADTLIDRVSEDNLPIQRSDVEEKQGGIYLSATSKRRYLVSRRVDEILKHGMIDEVIDDECHHILADSEYTLITRLWELCDALGRPKTRLTGYTATAFREDGKALGNVFQTICISRSSAWGQANGYLAPLIDPLRVEAKIPFGRSKVLKLHNWTEPIILAWLEKAASRPTLGYYDSVSSSIEATEKFRERGILSAHIDGTQTIDTDGSVHDIDYREVIYQKFLEGKVQVLNNYAVLLEGVDLPPASCMIWARPTENIVLLTQAVGRILRLFDGNNFLPPKENALIMDIVGDDITVMTAGTLAGYKVDPNTREYIKDDDDEMEVESVVDGRDLKDLDHGTTVIDGVIYSIGRLIRKSGSDWYHNESNGVQTLGISATDALSIVPPFYTLSNHLSRTAEKMSMEIEKGDSSMLEAYYRIQKAIELYSNYTLWHTKEKEYPKDWVYYDANLERLMDFAVPYMSEQSDPVSAFVSQKKKWKERPITEAQKPMLQGYCRLYNTRYIDTLTAGEASQQITYYKHFNGLVRPVLAKIYKELGAFAR